MGVPLWGASRNAVENLIHAVQQSNAHACMLMHVHNTKANTLLLPKPCEARPEWLLGQTTLHDAVKHLTADMYLQHCAYDMVACGHQRGHHADIHMLVCM